MPICRLSLWLSASLLLLGLAATVAVYLVAKRAEPVYDGKLVLAAPGLDLLPEDVEALGDPDQRLVCRRRRGRFPVQE